MIPPLQARKQRHRDGVTCPESRDSEWTLIHWLAFYKSSVHSHIQQVGFLGVCLSVVGQALCLGWRGAREAEVGQGRGESESRCPAGGGTRNQR